MSLDIAIVGAGPAGSWAAWCLARAGATVAIFDASHPREKPCGGGITSRALDIVGSRVAAALPHVVPSTAVFEDDRALARVPLRTDGFSGASSLAVMSRRDFDRALLDSAREQGAELVAERVTGIELRTDSVVLRTPARTCRARFVLGADGANSLVRRRLSRAFTRAQLSIAAGVFVHDVSDTAVVIRCVADPPGYIWSFPRHDHLAVGICAQADVTGPGSLKALVHAWLATTASLARDKLSSARQSVYSWPIPSLGPKDFHVQRVSGDRWMLLGDAAGLVDPLTREGISFALMSAEYAATALTEDRARERSAGPGERYRRQLDTHIYPELKRAAALKRRFFTGAFTSLMVEGLVRSAGIRQVMVDLIEARQPYVGLGRRLLKTGDLGLALRLLWRF